MKGGERERGREGERERCGGEGERGGEQGGREGAGRDGGNTLSLAQRNDAQPMHKLNSVIRAFKVL